MTDNKENKKKGFFSRLFGGSTSPDESSVKDTSSDEKNAIPTKSALNKMKKADIVESAKEHGLDLDINLTKAKLLEQWDNHFNSSSSTLDNTSGKAEVLENVSTQEEAPLEEAPAEEETPAEEEAPAEEETHAEEEAPVEEEAPEEEEAPVEEAPVEEDQPQQISLEEKTPAQIISSFESKQMKDDIPDFRPGDTVAVSVKVKEGERVRLQVFEGVVMGIKNAGLNSSFVVRKISSGIGVERTFQLHSPMIDSILVKRKGDVRQAKLFYLRERSGKSARIKERLD